MNKNIIPFLFLALFAYSSNGCAGWSQKDTDRWNDRIGGYTYEDAVQQLGLPTQKEKLNNGKLVAQWVVMHHHYIPGDTNVNSYGNTTTVTTSDGYSVQRQEVMVLTFVSHGVLANWHWSMR